MASLPQISASLVSANNQNTLGLANFTLELSLLKFSAPAEYTGLVTALSQKRRESAEEGPLHRTARKLGLLFEQIIPPIPDLIRAYGTRVSEIASIQTKDGKGGGAYGPFSAHAGVDGTSIYAAATSGPAALAVHLLACMLAQSFEAPQATAIWVELVAERKKELELIADNSQLQGLMARAVVQQEINRLQLAAWDASARAWLRTADEAKKFELTQLRLIVRNCGLSLNSLESTYKSVIDTWTTAMTSLQKLILGIPHNISKASVLIGLLSWHIYPDLNVLEPMTNIQFHDPLVGDGGAITLGLQRADSLGDGVHWSLSLSHLRFYGHPVSVQKSIGSPDSDDGRLTIPELHLVTLGCVISQWQDSEVIDLIAAADCFVALGECLDPSDLEARVEYFGESESMSLEWLKILIDAAKHFIQAEGVEREQALVLVELGRRRGRKFLDDSAQSTYPMFGLCNPLVIYSFLSRHENTVSELRKLALDCGFDENECLIRYRPQVSDLTGIHDGNLENSYRGDLNYEYTTAVPHSRHTCKRARDGEFVETSGHSSWIHIDSTVNPVHQHVLDLQAANIQTQYSVEGKEKSIFNIISPCSCQELCTLDCSCKLNDRQCTTQCQCPSKLQLRLEDCGNLRSRRLDLTSSAEKCRWLLEDDIVHTSTKQFTWCHPPIAFFRCQSKKRFTIYNIPSLIHQPISTMKYSFAEESDYDRTAAKNSLHYRMLAGDQRNAGLFTLHEESRSIKLFTLQDLAQILRCGKMSSPTLTGYLKSLPNHGICDNSTDTAREPTKTKTLFSSLNALVAASDLYKEWHGATVAIENLEKPLAWSRWVQVLESKPSLLNSHAGGFVSYRACKFACIAMLESGKHDLYPHQLNNVMAMASGNSIFVAEALLQDPSDIDRSDLPQFTGIKRILGSLDRPGLIMLIPPQAPKIRKTDLKKWKVVNQVEFDGKPANCFPETSLHLSFTDYEFPIAISPGAVDAEVFLLEALISVHEGRQWVADLDVLGNLLSCSAIHLPPCYCSVHLGTEKLGTKLAKVLGSQGKSITNWEEYLCRNENLMRTEIGIVRTTGNWLARLAAVCLAAPQKYSTVVLPKDALCGECGERIVGEVFWKDSASNLLDLVIA